MLKREEWEGFVRDVDWGYTYVDHEAVYPEWQSGTGKVPREAWLAWEEDYKVSYPEYVATQRDKETATYGVKAALQRSKAFDHLDEGWKSATKMHFGGVALVEYAAVLAELKMARFGLNGAWRNMATFGQLDELRHAQITTLFGHEFVAKDPQYDWTQKTFHTNNWLPIALRNLFDGMMLAPNAVDLAIELPLTFETGFTNLQFVALAADALESGDVNFANMISSIQTDEARHSQQGGPTLEILVAHDPVRAQWVIDKSFWGSARVFAALTGPAMDYYTPLEHRKQSYREFMEEWIIDQFIRTVEDYGLRRPWFWDEFMRGLDTWHHGLHMGLWYWRPTLWWRPKAGVSKAEREWLAEKLPELGEALRRQMGRPNRQRQRQQPRGHIARHVAVAVQHVPPPMLQPNPVPRRPVAGAGLVARIRRPHLPLLHQRVPTDLLEGPRQRQPRDADRPFPRRPDPTDGRRRSPRLHGIDAGRDRR